MYKIPKNTPVTLTNGTIKNAIDIDINDDICDKWLKTNYKMYKYTSTN
jgi:hypothetical protein